MNKKIVQNSIICNSCKEEIYSASVHDFRYCSCEKVAVDGGMEYLRRIGIDYTDTSFYMEEKTIEDIKNAVKWGKDTGRNDLGIALAVFRALRKNGLIVENDKK